MPTPFMHLRMAERMLQHPDLDPSLARRLRTSWPAFYLGSVAADYQTICQIPREDTHFYTLPPAADAQAHVAMLQRFPELAAAAALDADQAVFVAAYSAHLMLDLLWYHHVLQPYFLQPSGWPADRRARFLVHNILLTFLDRRAYDALPSAAGAVLDNVRTAHWLPFADDADLRRWQGLLVQQLQPGAAIKTVEIYAGRLRMTPREFAEHLQDNQWMEAQVFRRVPLAAVDALLTAAVGESIALISEYLQAPRLATP